MQTRHSAKNGAAIAMEVPVASIAMKAPARSTKNGSLKRLCGSGSMSVILCVDRHFYSGFRCVRNVTHTALTPGGAMLSVWTRRRGSSSLFFSPSRTGSSCARSVAGCNARAATSKRGTTMPPVDRNDPRSARSASRYGLRRHRAIASLFAVALVLVVSLVAGTLVGIVVFVLYLLLLTARRPRSWS
jgi:hypothetical protein